MDPIHFTKDPLVLFATGQDADRDGHEPSRRAAEEPGNEVAERSGIEQRDPEQRTLVPPQNDGQDTADDHARDRAQLVGTLPPDTENEHRRECRSRDHEGPDDAGEQEVRGIEGQKDGDDAAKGGEEKARLDFLVLVGVGNDGRVDIASETCPDHHEQTGDGRHTGGQGTSHGKRRDPRRRERLAHDDDQKVSFLGSNLQSLRVEFLDGEELGGKADGERGEEHDANEHDSHSTDTFALRTDGAVKKRMAICGRPMVPNAMDRMMPT